MDCRHKRTDAQRRKIITAVTELQAAENISNREIGRIIGCSTAVWSQIVNSKYSGDVDKYLTAADAWLGDRGRREAPVGDYVETQIGKWIQTVCRRAATMPCIGLIVTRSGAGKSAALTNYARRSDSLRTIYLQAGEMHSTKAALVSRLSDAVGITNSRRSAACRRYDRLREHLAGLYSGGKAAPVLIIVDEATTLHPSAINMLRNLHDDPAVRAGIVLADTWRLDGELRRRNRMTGGYEQLRSRCGAQYLMTADTEIARQDVQAVTNSILKSLGRSRPLAATSYSYLHRLAQSPGAFRNILHRLHAVCDLAAGSGVKPTWSVAELDYAAVIVGGQCEMPAGSVCPFTAPPAAAKRKTA